MASIGVQHLDPEEHGKQPRPAELRAHIHARDIRKKHLKATVHIAFLRKPPCVRQSVQTPETRGTDPVLPRLTLPVGHTRIDCGRYRQGTPLPTTVGTAPPRRSRPVPVPQRCFVSSLPHSPTNRRCLSGRRTLIKSAGA